eukprot:2774269-Karenia_brevis.AAC.1
MAQLGTRSPPVGTKMIPRHFNLKPKRSQDSPTWSQGGPKTSPFGTKLVPRPITLRQDGPKTLQPGAKMAPRFPDWSQGIP